MKRRTVLQSAAAGAVTLSVGALPFGVARMLAPTAAQADPSRHLRPPGALKPDADFVSACIACNLCSEVCPPDCIRFHVRDGGDQAGTPYIDPVAKACILCNKCMEVCPTESLTPVADRWDIDMGVADIDETACYPWVDRGICGACATVCPLGEHAIGFDFANIYRPIVREGCVGCGLCVEICPHPSKPIKIIEREIPKTKAEA